MTEQEYIYGALYYTKHNNNKLNNLIYSKKRLIEHYNLYIYQIHYTININNNENIFIENDKKLKLIYSQQQNKKIFPLIFLFWENNIILQSINYKQKFTLSDYWYRIYNTLLNNKFNIILQSFYKNFIIIINQYNNIIDNDYITKWNNRIKKKQALIQREKRTYKRLNNLI